MLHTLQVFSSSITDAHVEDQQGVIVQGSDKPLQSLHNILDLSPKQAANFPRQQIKAANVGLQPAQQGTIYNYPCCFLLMPYSSQPSSATRALNLLGRHRSTGRQEQSSIARSHKLPTFTNGEPPFPHISIGFSYPHFSTSVGGRSVWRVKLLNLQDLTEDPVNLLFSIPTATQSADLLQLHTWQHRLPPAHTSCRQGAQFPSPRDQASPQPQTCRAASSLQGSVCVKVSAVPG